MKPEEDAYGQEVYAYHRDPEARIQEIIERDDGYIDISGGPAAYFAPYEEWSRVDQELIKFAQGRVLDVGCGAGRVALYLQKKGHDVVAIDNSPLAVKVCRERGVADARVLSVTQASRNTLGTFDTIVMFGNNFGLFGSRRRAPWLLRRFYRMTSPEGRILAITNDVRDTENPHHREYHEWNRQRGRMPGQIRIRVRFRKTVGPWFDYLMVSPEEMEDLLTGSGWAVERILRDPDSSIYGAVIAKG
jgi:SAM-dependent methyltransferase